MLLIVLFAVLILIAVFLILTVSLAVSKAVNGFFFGIFGNLFLVVKLFQWIKKIFLIGIIIKLFSIERKQKKLEKEQKAE